MKPEECTIEYATEVLLDILLRVAEGKDDHELVFPASYWRAVGSACGVEMTDEIDPIPAGLLRERAREARAFLARRGVAL